MDREILDRIDIRQGDITTLKVDAIVNAANTSLLGGGGVDGAIHRAAGPDLLVECRTIGGCPTGEARITRGYHLPARHVIHTVGPVFNIKTATQARERLNACYRNSLELAVRNHLATIAFPAISCGVYGYPIKDACKVAIDTTIDFINNTKSIKCVTFILFSATDRQVYQDYLTSF